MNIFKKMTILVFIAPTMIFAVARKSDVPAAIQYAACVDKKSVTELKKPVAPKPNNRQSGSHEANPSKKIGSR